MGAQLTLAFMIDLAAGEQRESWHPVCWMGRAVGLTEEIILGGTTNPRLKRLAGALAAAALPAGTYLLSRKLLGWLPRPLAGTVEVALIASSLAGRSLYDGARAVEDSLAASLEEGRSSVAHMVGRDTALLDEEGVTRAAIESVAENTNDGVIAPMFYGLVGGAPLALAYKMVNTMDSMIGYRNPRYESFGWAAARLDDAAGFVPARLTALSALAAYPLVGGCAGRAITVWRQDTRGHLSPNAGVCEAVFAGVLGVRLGGRNYYSGSPAEGPVLGQWLAAPARGDIGRSARLMYSSAALFLVGGTLARWLLWRKRGK